MSLAAQIALFLAATVVAVPLFRRFRLSAVLAYLVSGIVIGPFGFGLVTDVEEILAFAEFGVVLLLFVIGLELQPSRLKALRRVVFGLGSAQVVVTTALLAGLGALAGFSWTVALVAGFGLSLSSTALVLQLLAERGTLTTHHGRGAFGVLLFQDLAVLPALALLPVLGAGVAAEAGMSGQGFALAVGAVAVLVVVARYLLRPALRFVAATRIPDVFTAAALLVVLATALLVHAVGLSMALGAFIAGVLLADSEYRHELEADLEPFKGLLLGLFFIAVGMSVNLGLLAARPLALLLLTLGFMAAKGLAAYAVGRLFPVVGNQARSLALALLAGGEFAFVLFPLAGTSGLLDRDQVDLLVLAVTLSMLLSPLILMADDRWLRPWLEAAPPPAYDELPADRQPVVIAGFGRFGQIVARILRGQGIPFTALDANQTQVDFVRRYGNQVFYGDAGRLELLRSAGLAEARVLVLAVDDVEASVRIAGLVRRHFPGVRIFARARNRQHAFRLMDLGVDYVIRETYVSSLEMAAAVLEAAGTSPTAARRSAAIFREQDEATLRRQFEFRDDDAKLRDSTLASARQLEQLFEADRVAVDDGRGGGSKGDRDQGLG